MKQKTFLCIIFQIVFLGGLLPGICQALLNDTAHGRWNLLGKVKAQATFRTVDTPDNNSIPIKAGDLINQRNLLMLEFKHDLGQLLAVPQIEYYLQGRAYYDSVWDIGPDIFTDDETRQEYLFDNRDQIDDLKTDIDLFLGYMDVTYGFFFTRFGRQIISWGEMSTKRILDGTNPLDTTASLAVDLLERMVPLAMVRSSVAFDDVGPFSSIGVEGYYIPGAIESKNGEELIDGSAIFPPIGQNTLADLEDPFSMSSLMQIIEQVPDDIDLDRYGVKVNMMIGDLDLNFAYYRAYSDVPVPFLDVASFNPIYLTWFDILSFDLNDPLGSILGDQKMKVILKYDKVDVYGSSFNYYLSMLDIVLRGEIALFKNVPKILPGGITDLVNGLAGKIYLPIEGLTLGNLISGIDLGALLGDLDDMVLPFSSGKIATHDVWKYGIAIDKNIVLPLNREKEFMVMLEYVGSKIVGYEEDTLIYPWQGPNGEPVYEPEFTHDIILIARTEYLNGLLTPQLTLFYEVVPEALVLIPGLTVTKGPWLFDCTYMHTIANSYEQEGFLESRKELSISFTYLF